MPESSERTEKERGRETQPDAHEAREAGEGARTDGSRAEGLDARVRVALHAAGEKKALDLVVLDLRELASFTDFFVIASGTNVRQVQAIADEVQEQLRKQTGTKPARVEGYKSAEWVLLDYGDFIFHVFEEKSRRFYDLERLWRDAVRVELPRELAGGEGSLRSER
ncbi:MAG TPA: ribosome silencing factor [Pyrinomonadaceae bacterium]|nr:ribosome silencing factor [Pyrinomonadaceae bacterium]